MKNTQGRTLKQIQAEKFRRCLDDYAHALKTRQPALSECVRAYAACRDQKDRALVARVFKTNA